MPICCHPECSIPVNLRQVACLDHWRQVDKHTRCEVQHRLRGWKSIEAAREYLNAFFKRQLKEVPANDRIEHRQS